MILGGMIQGGDRLLEVSLGEELRVSRTPIREALITLAEEGLIEYRPNRGYVVRSFTLDEVMDAYVVREALESLACRVIAERGLDRKAEQELQECLAKGDEILRVERLSQSLREPWGHMNHHFHTLLMASANNNALRDAWLRVINIPFSSSRVVHWFDDGDVHGLFELRLVHSQHHQIFQSLRNREGFRAETAMKAHIAYAAEHIRSTYVVTDGLNKRAVHQNAVPELSRQHAVTRRKESSTSTSRGAYKRLRRAT